VTTFYLLEVLWWTFAHLFDNFRQHDFCFVYFALKNLQYKTLLPFIGGGGGVKAIPRTALLLSKSRNWLTIW
jgi:hypothetical protein